MVPGFHEYVSSLLLETKPGQRSTHMYALEQRVAFLDGVVFKLVLSYRKDNSTLIKGFQYRPVRV